MKPVLEQPRVVAHNLKFEKAGLRTVGIEIGSLACTMLQAYVLSLWPEVGQKFLVEKVFGHKQRTIEELFPTAKVKELDALRFNTLGLTPDVVAYGCEDSSYCLALHQMNMPKLEADRSLLSIYRMEMGIMEMMLDSEQHGVGVDWDTMEKWLVQAIEFMGALEEEVRADFGALLGRSIAGLNVKSPHQLRAIFFDDPPNGLGLTPTRWTKGGETRDPVPSTEEVALVHLAKRDDPCRGGGEEAPDRSRGGQPSQAVRAVARQGPAQVPEPRLRRPGPRALRADPCRDGEVQRRQASDPAAPEEVLASSCATAGPSRATSATSSSRRPAITCVGSTTARSSCGRSPGSRRSGASSRRSSGETMSTRSPRRSCSARMSRRWTTEHDRPIGKTMNFAIIYQMGVKSLADRLGISHGRSPGSVRLVLGELPGHRELREQVEDGVHAADPAPVHQVVLREDSGRSGTWTGDEGVHR